MRSCTVGLRAGARARCGATLSSVLCALTPARDELLVIFSQDRSKALIELVKHLELATKHVRTFANLLAEVESHSPTEPSKTSNALRRSARRYFSAGGGASLTEGSKLLGVSRQALHKPVKAGTALGMMVGEEIVLPKLQWVVTGDKAKFVDGLPERPEAFRAGRERLVFSVST